MQWESSQVVWLQQVLKHFGYYEGYVDGDYSSRTRRAVEDLQGDLGLAATGILPQDPSSLLDMLAGDGHTHNHDNTRPYLGKHDDERPTLRRGDQGQYVEQLQRHLAEFGLYKGPVDGDFGPKTDHAVEAFQRARKLVVDGDVGAKTWAAIDQCLKSGFKIKATRKGQGGIGDRLTALTFDGKGIPIPDGLVVRRSVRFSRRTRRATSVVDSLWHLNAGPGNPAVFFKSKGLGVHLFIEFDGVIWAHDGDLKDRLVHGGFLNSTSIGLEVRNCVVPQDKGKVWAHGLQTQYIKARWAWKGLHCLPTLAQLQAAYRLQLFLNQNIPSLSSLFWAQSGQGVSSARQKHLDYKPGIGAHRHFSSHSDGVLIANYLFLRIVKGMSHAQAWDATIEQHSDDGKIYLLDDLVPNRPMRPLGTKGASDEIRRPWSHDD